MDTKPVVGYLINLTVTQLLNLVPVAGEVYIRTPGEVFLVDGYRFPFCLHAS